MAILIYLFFLSLTGPNPKPASAMPPASPINCNQSVCILSNSYGAFNDRKQCLVPTVLYPTTEDEIRSAVAEANKNSLKVKVVSGFSHTIPKLACPDPTRSVLISTAKYSTGIEVDTVKRTVTVESGVGLRDLINAVEAHGLSLVASPYWEGVSIGGLISTGSHGSSWWGRGGAVHDHVVGVRIVVAASKNEGFAKVLDVDESKGSLFDAVRVSLGLLGVISKVSFFFRLMVGGLIHENINPVRNTLNTYKQNVVNLKRNNLNPKTTSTFPVNASYNTNCMRMF